MRNAEHLQTQRIRARDLLNWDVCRRRATGGLQRNAARGHDQGGVQNHSIRNVSRVCWKDDQPISFSGRSHNKWTVRCTSGPWALWPRTSGETDSVHVAATDNLP